MKGLTTSVAHALAQHPDIFLPKIKEPHYFTTDIFKNTDRLEQLSTHGFANIRRIGSLKRYLALYARAPKAARYRIDASTSYLYSEEATRNILDFDPDAKIVILLRDPVARAWSEYGMNKAIGVELSSFRQAVERELQEMRENILNPYKRYIHASRYGDQVERVLKLFPRENILIEVVDRPGRGFQAIMASLAAFLGLPEGATFTELKKMVTQAPRLRLLNHILYFTGVKGILIRVIPPRLKDAVKQVYFKSTDAAITPEDQVFLAEIFEESTRKVERLTGLDLSHWTRPRGAAEAPANAACATAKPSRLSSPLAAPMTGPDEGHLTA